MNVDYVVKSNLKSNMAQQMLSYVIQENQRKLNNNSGET